MKSIKIAAALLLLPLLGCNKNPIKPTPVVPVTVVTPPTIEMITVSFTVSSTASIVPGESARLLWSVTAADKVVIDPEVGEVDKSGSKAVSPLRTTTYTLTASKNTGEKLTKALDVTVDKILEFEIAAQGGSYENEMWVSLNGKKIATRYGGEGIGRGFNFLTVDRDTGVRGRIRNFDTWLATGSLSRGEPTNTWSDMALYLNGLPNGTLVLAWVYDEAGLTSVGCSALAYGVIESGRRAVEALGSRQIRNYCYRNSWSMFAIKGEGSKDEALSVTGPAVTHYTLNLR